VVLAHRAYADAITAMTAAEGLIVTIEVEVTKRRI
jgi:hypothetical protein